MACQVSYYFSTTRREVVMTSQMHGLQANRIREVRGDNR
jgi:hypothetical protein